MNAPHSDSESAATNIAQAFPRHQVFTHPADSGKIDVRAELIEGEWRISSRQLLECYCGFVCPDHQNYDHALVCLWAHRLFCNWDDHLDAFKVLNDHIKPF